MLNALWMLAEIPPPTWGMFAQGEVAPFLFLVVFVALVYYMISRARAGQPIPEIRKIAGLDAVDEAVGRATEMGRPVHYSPGISAVENEQTIASFAMLSYVAKTCAQYDTRLIQTNRNYIVHAVNEEIIKQAYLEAGRPDAHNPDDCRYISGFQFAYTAGVLGILKRERPAANIMYGAFFAESMMMLEVASHIGAVQIGATANTAQLPFFMAAADYTLIGEEMYAASAYLSREPVLRGTVVGQDLTRIIIFAIIIIGTIIQQIDPDTNALTRFMRTF